ncbi:PTS sugar transporter subunit IIB [Microbacterium sp. NPDC055903]
MRILVVCGAGASSTFVAQRLRRAAMAAGLDWDAVAGTEQTVATQQVDLIMVGPHLADRLDGIRRAAGVLTIPLPTDIFTDREGDRALALAIGALSPSDPLSEKGTS